MNCLGKGVEAMRDDDKSTGTADHTVEVILVEIFELGKAEAIGPVVDDGQAVDGDAVLDGNVAGEVDERTAVVGAVAGDVDDPTGSLIAIIVEQWNRILDGAANRGAPADTDLGFGERIGERPGACSVLDRAQLAIGWR